MPTPYEELLRQFASHVGLDVDALLTTEEVLIDGIAVGLQQDGSTDTGDLLFFATLGVPTPEHLARIMRTLLEANNLWVGTGGCTLGLQRETGAITLAGRMALQALDGETLAVLLDGFVDTASFWKGFVEGSPQGDGAPAPAFDPAFGLRA